MLVFTNLVIIYKVLMKFCNEQKQPPEVFCEKRCSWKFHKIHRKTPVPESLFLIKLQALGTLAQVFSCEFCEISKNTFFTEYVWTTASEWKLQGFSWRLDSHICYSYILLINTPDINSWYTNPPPYFQRNRFFSLSWIKVMKTSNLIF